MTRLGFNSDVNLGCPYTGRWQLRAKLSKKVLVDRRNLFSEISKQKQKLRGNLLMLRGTFIW